jgi:hypothetical protein
MSISDTLVWLIVSGEPEPSKVIREVSDRSMQSMWPATLPSISARPRSFQNLNRNPAPKASKTRAGARSWQCARKRTANWWTTWRRSSLGFETHYAALQIEAPRHRAARQTLLRSVSRRPPGAVHCFPSPLSRRGPNERLESPAECSFIRKSDFQSHF